MDQASNPVFLEFVDEYILALRDITEKELIREIYGYYEARFYNGMTQALLKNAVPHWILWNFKVIHKDYYAVEQLYESRTPMSGEIRLSNNYLILTGTTRPWIKDEMMEGFYIDEYAPEVEAVKKELISRDKETDWDLIGQVLDNRYDWPLRIPEGKWFTDKMIDLIQSKSSSTGLEYRYLHGIYVMGTTNDRNWLFGINEYIPLWPEQDKKDTSLLSELWWQDYCEAVKALSETPENYSVPRIQLSFSSDWDPHMGGGPNLDQRKGWEQNSIDEINVRAFVYAWLKNTGRETPLENIVIYLKKSENNLPLFLAFIMERSDNCRLIPVRKGIDLLSFCDLSVARKYVEENSN